MAARKWNRCAARSRGEQNVTCCEDKQGAGQSFLARKAPPFMRIQKAEFQQEDMKGMRKMKEQSGWFSNRLPVSSPSCLHVAIFRPLRNPLRAFRCAAKVRA
jgi:hypothetical protein